jgi:hypothetical protein
MIKNVAEKAAQPIVALKTQQNASIGWLIDNFPS